jgi:hypothetical protein
MEKINNLISEIKSQCDEFMVDALNNVKGNKAAGRRARKISSNLTKLFKDYRTLTLEAEKNA